MKKLLLSLGAVFCLNAQAQCPAVTITSEYGIICNSQPNQFIASGGASWQWQPPPLNSSISGDTVIVKPSVSTTYTVTATTGTCVTTKTITLVVNNCIPPTVGFLINTDTTCVNHCITFKDTTQLHSTKPLFYKWVFPGGSISPVTGSTVQGDTLYYAMTTSATLSPIRVCYHTTSITSPGGFFPVTQLVTNGINQTNIFKDSVLVAPAPLVNFSLVQDAAPHTWKAITTYQSYLNPVSATWYWGDGTSTVGLYPSHTYATPGKYTISVNISDKTGCTDSISQNDSLYRYANNSTQSTMVYVNVINNLAGIKNTHTTSDINIYPNPAQNNFTIETSINEKQILQVFDVNGKQVLTQAINGNATIDISNLSNGIYNACITNSSGVVNKKVVIVK